MDKTLHLLGLAYRGGHVQAGEDAAGEAAVRREARLLLLAEDAAGGVRRQAEYFAREGQCLLLEIPYDKAQLGSSCGRGSCALLAVTELGLAAAVVQRLRETDPQRYDRAAQRMELKRRRLQERREQKARREKAPAPQRPEKTVRPEPEPRRARRDEERPAAKAGRRPNQTREGQRSRSGAKAPGASGGKRPLSGRKTENRFSAGRFANSRPVHKGKGSPRPGNTGKSGGSGS